MVATTGAKLLPPEAVSQLRMHLLPQTTILTPNVPEAGLLLANAGYDHMAVESVADLETIAKAVHGLGSEWVLVKGGHAPFKRNYAAAHEPEEREIVVDVLVGSGRVIKIETEYQDSRNTHGTGCSLACKLFCWDLSASRRGTSCLRDTQLPSRPTWPRVWMWKRR